MSTMKNGAILQKCVNTFVPHCRRCNGKSGYISAEIITIETRINKLLNTQD